MNAISQEHIIELTNIVGAAPSPMQTEPATETPAAEPETASFKAEVKERDKETGGVDFSTAAAGVVSEEQLEVALERVVKKMLADKIDAILEQVIENAVDREIEHIKNEMEARW